jgi:hypothetical protein
MPNPTQTWSARCACGQTEFVARGAPLITLACYCDDCQAAAKQIDAMPSGHSGLGGDGGTISTLFRKDLMSCVRGQELLVDHKLRPSSHATRAIASCCNSNMLTRFDNWLPMVAMRTHSPDDAPRPQICIHTRHAPNKAEIIHPVPKHAALAPNLLLKVMGAAAALQFQRLGLDGSRVY